MSIEELNKLLLQFEALQDALRPLEDEAKKLKEKIKATLTEANLDNFSAGRTTATVYETTRTYYPAKKLEETFTESELKKVREVRTYQSFRVSTKNEKTKRKD